MAVSHMGQIREFENDLPEVDDHGFKIAYGQNTI